jgi:hypothetical protein
MNQIQSKHQFSRRRMLRGIGVSMALPCMESARVWGGEPARVEPSSEAPVRLAALFSGNGFHSKEWWAQGEGAGMGLGQVLEPLSDFRRKMLVIRGLFNAEAQKGNIHSSQTGNLLSGAPLASGGEIRSGTSIDQILAQRYRASTKVASLVLGCEKSNPSVHKNYSMLYSSHISWSSPTAPAPLEVYPALAFDRLLKDEAGKGDQSVLDAVLAGAGNLRRGISAFGRRKLDEYLEPVRDVEKRIPNAGKRGELQGWRPALEKPNLPRPADGIPQNIAEHVRLMPDILVLAFETGTTRITTLKLNNDHSSLRFPNLGVDYMIHHLLSHSGTADWLKGNRFFLEQVVYRAQARFDSGRSPHAARPHHDAVLFEHADRESRRHAASGGVVGRRGRPHRGRARVDLQRQARPADVPSVSFDDGQDEVAHAEVRRRHRGARRSIAMRGNILRKALA